MTMYPQTRYFRRNCSPHTIHLTEDDLKECLLDMDLVHYTKTERKYMCALLSTPGFITKEAIHHHIYRHDPEGGPNDKIIDVFLCKVRRKLREANSRFFIITHWGYGIGLAMGVSPPYELDLV